MQTLKTVILSIAFAMTALSPAPVTAQERTSQMRRVSGRIVEIDRPARTVTIRDGRTGGVLKARVPEGQLLTLCETANPGSLPRSIPFELVIRGLVVDLFVVESIANQPVP